MTTYTPKVVSGVSGRKPSKHFGNLDRQRLREREREMRFRYPRKMEETL